MSSCWLNDRYNKSYLLEKINEMKQKLYAATNQKEIIVEKLEQLIVHEKSPLLKQVFGEFKNLNNDLDIFYFNTLNNLIHENLNYPGPDRFIMEKREY